jgi:signal peptidase I, archaeal type
MRKVLNILFLVIVILILISPFILSTSTLPIAIVAGNSMYPTLQNGDLIIFKGPPTGPIPVGTIIIYVEPQIGNNFLGWLTGRIIIHRVVSVQKMNDNSYYYITKGDNNLFNDTLPVKQSNVLGIPVLVIPKQGLLFLFISTPQGLIVIIGILIVYYLKEEDNRRNFERKMHKFLLLLGNEMYKGHISKDLFDKLDVDLRYAYELEEIEDKDVRKIGEWVAKTKLKDWNMSYFECDVCKKGIQFETKKLTLKICNHKVDLIDRTKR